MTGYSSRLLNCHNPCFTATLVDLVGLKNSRGVEKGFMQRYENNILILFISIIIITIINTLYIIDWIYQRKMNLLPILINMFKRLITQRGIASRVMIGGYAAVVCHTHPCIPLI